ncbi:MAG TPA: flagellar basal body P-ring protein FlgI [bacterium]|nr:flagellar basal body P-ring protein FlgI [bacterium]HOL48305.1 flagellar basal body P-ring protein FlgI [bacterium]HPQ19805.1 flagellar basal body P-ring protein FlgI [bacterium]
MLKLVLIILIITINLINGAVVTKIKDITNINGIRENQLQGFGLVVGLEGTGDSKKATFTVQAYANMLKRYGINIDPSKINFDNVASVIVKATLPPFVRPGQKIDVIVATPGDAENLDGGLLLQTPLLGADGEVYAVAQGPVTIGGYNVKSGGSKAQKNHPTVGRVINGAMIEKDVPMEFVQNGKIQIILKNSDFTTLSRVIDVINNFFKEEIAKGIDGAAIDINIPEVYQNKIPQFLSSIQNLDVVTEAPAKIVINTRTGTIVMGENVKISKVAVSHGNLTVIIKSEDEVSQPEAFSQGQTTLITKSSVSAKEEGSSVMLLKDSPTINEVVSALNEIGATPRDIISILQAIKEVGALNAELELI